jgi:20S proteasome subunit alpha 6
MFRNQYDTDVTVWSPEGRLLQVEYAMESVKQGSACVGLRSNEYVVLGALKRAVSELSSHQKKILEIDDHMGVGIAGLTADARSLAKYMRNECWNHKYVYGAAMPPHMLMSDLADKHQRTTQTYVRRPFGVGLLVAAMDPRGNTPHLYQTCPSGNLYEYYASAVGARSQSAKTYLEKHNESFAECGKDDLIVHALQALVGCVSGDDELTKDNGSIGIVGKDMKFTLLEGDALQPYLDKLELKGGDEEEEVKDEEEEADAMET